MIKNSFFSGIKIETQLSEQSNEIQLPDSITDVFLGPNIDQRCKDARNFLVNTNSHVILYNPKNFMIQFDDEKISVDVFDNFIKNYKFKDGQVLIECSSVGVAELLLLIGALYHNGVKKFSALYLEPKIYKNIGQGLNKLRTFSLSRGYDGYTAVPGYALSVEPSDYITFCCGFETERIQNAFEDEPIDSNNNSVSLIFGMPPYSAGWDMNSYDNHIKFIDLQGIMNIYFCGASNPLAVIKKLTEEFKGVGEHKLFIAPLGTKPMSLGVCLFIVKENAPEKIGFLFDHPQKENGRSSKVNKWLLYNIEM